jgi:hypothetical protein
MKWDADGIVLRSCPVAGCDINCVVGFCYQILR